MEPTTAPIDPSFDLKAAMEALQIDPKDPNFSEEEMINMFTGISRDQKIGFQDRERFANLVSLLKTHKFWDNQAIVLPRQQIKKEGPIKQFKKEEISDEPTTLPAGFKWANYDVTDDKECQEVCDFLTRFYVEDDEGSFRLIYPMDKFRWGVQTPGFIKDLHFCVRSESNNKIMATIAGVPKKV